MEEGIFRILVSMVYPGDEQCIEGINKNYDVINYSTIYRLDVRRVYLPIYYCQFRKTRQCAGLKSSD